MPSPFRLLHVVVISAVLAACSEPLLPSLSGDGLPVVTDADRYTLESTSTGWRGKIGYSFFNKTGRPISLLNCRGGYALELQQQQGDQWVTAWSPILLGCLSPPIRIEPGDSIQDVVEIYGGRAGSNSYPQFATTSIDGTYRLVIESAYWDYNHDGPPWGDSPPVEYRVSHSFEIRTER